MQSTNTDFEDISDSPRKKKGSIVKAMLTGNEQFRAFVGRNLLYILMIIGLILFYIHNGYQVEEVSKERMRLKEQVARLRSEATTTGAELMRISSRNTIKQELRRRNLPLNDASRPPVILSMKDDNE